MIHFMSSLKLTVQHMGGLLNNNPLYDPDHLEGKQYFSFAFLFHRPSMIYIFRKIQDVSSFKLKLSLDNSYFEFVPLFKTP